MKAPIIFVADDDITARTLIEIALSSVDLNVELFSDGTQLLERCQQTTPDLVMVDVQMPGILGTEVCSRIKTWDDCYIPVMMLTSQAELNSKLAGFSCGADDYVTKPFQVAELLARVKALLKIKLLTDKLMNTQNLLKEKERELVVAQVAGAAAHELGQPLTALLLDCSLLSHFEMGSKDYHETLQNIINHCEKMRSILDSFNRTTVYQTIDYVGDLQIIDINAK